MLFPQFIPTAALGRLKMNERSTSAARLIKNTHFDRVIEVLFMLFFSKQSDLMANTLLCHFQQNKRGCFISVALEQSR